MSLVRVGSVCFLVAASSLSIACSASSSTPGGGGELTYEEMGDTSSALVLSKVEGAATLAVASDDGACTEIRALVEPRLADLKALCADKQVPVPVAHDGIGCELGSVKTITFECRAVNLPPLPKEGCRDIEVKDDGAMPEGAELEAPLVCPRLGGAPPVSAGEQPSLAHAPNGPRPPMPPMPGAGERPERPAGGDLPAPPAARDGNAPPMPPKGIRCCAPPPPPAAASSEATDG